MRGNEGMKSRRCEGISVEKVSVNERRGTSKSEEEVEEVSVSKRK